MKRNLEEVISQICSGSDLALMQSMNPIADHYRAGADLSTLLPLLNHSDPRVAECGAWIASEIVDGQRGYELYESLVRLLSNARPSVRFWCIESVALLMRPSDQSVIRRWLMLAVDADPGVRMQALYYICLIPDSIIFGLSGTNSWRSVKILADQSRKDEIRVALNSDNPFDRRMAMAASMRNFGSDTVFLQDMLPHFDHDVREAFHTLPKNRELPQ